ncbi:transketolase [Pandoraea norimbergensis]|uniref:Transketolase n=1 Tax=Pandoraea norimbergensis TaxID=93219 RepID=A0ABM5WS71_9BURK|nr:transketolase [Pandoraea norimbergensis]ALS63586.1 transketolase [Pandoraea norimbergensis]
MEPSVIQQQDPDLLCINTLRTLSIDAVQKAQSGHPGTPMDAAPTLYCLWQRFLRYDPGHPHWLNRDRFVLSNGHACALLYSLLHLCDVKGEDPDAPTPQTYDGLAITMQDLTTFRQAGSHCTGHPEYGWTTGVETTTGPLGQGIATSVGMAISQRWLSATYDRPGFALFDHNVYALCGDGDMMEGLGAEAASLAGHLKLANLCWIYDDNHITIEGSTRLAFTEDVAARFVAYGWYVERVSDANDLAQLSAAYQRFLDTDDAPTLIVVQSHIGYGAPHRQDTREAHGEPLGEAEVRLAKQFYGMDPDKQFDIPDGVTEHLRDNFGRRGAEAYAEWVTQFSAYRAQYPDLADALAQMSARKLPSDWDALLPTFDAPAPDIATRAVSGKVLNAIAARVPWLIGGAADLSPSTLTRLTFDGAGDFQPPAPDDDGTYAGRNFHFGVREHAMCAIANGMSLSLLRPFVSSFLIFTDYCRAALRLGAMMELPLITIWTHDSISLGEDGPTHQPVEQLASLRAMPGMIVMRPADAGEVVEAWRFIMTLRHTPVCLALTRQPLPVLDRTRYASASGVSRGAYVLIDACVDAGLEDTTPDVLLLASGSEVALCVAAYDELRREGILARVVSMPSWEVFESQSQAYHDSVLPPELAARVAVEEASSFGWERYTGIGGAILGLHTFGMSAPREALARHFGFDVTHVVAAAKAQIMSHGVKPRSPANIAGKTP